MLRLHLDLEKLVFSISLLPHVFKKKFLVQENFVTSNLEAKFDVINIYKL